MIGRKMCDYYWIWHWEIPETVQKNATDLASLEENSEMTNIFTK